MFNLTPTVRNLLVFTVLVFLAQDNLRNLPLTELGSLYPLTSSKFHFWQFGTYMFLHGNWGHLFSNIFGLVIFGPMLEQRWGGQRFVVYWLLCGIGAGILYEGVRAYEIHQITQAAAEFHRLPSGADFVRFYDSFFPEYSGYQTLGQYLNLHPTDGFALQKANEAIDAAVYSAVSAGAGMLGASGALFGVLFAFAYLFPNTELFFFFVPFPIKAKYFVFFYALWELYQGIHRTPGDTVAHFAHIGGLLIGFIILKFWESGRARFY